MSAVRIGVFDSGVGGLSVLRALHSHLPGACFHYVADSGHAPYGERSDQHVLNRSQRIARHLFEHGAQLLVIACNTATAVAVSELRRQWPHRPIVGVEPGIKPALSVTRNGRIGVMATAATLRSAKFLALLAQHAAGQSMVLRACTGLAGAIERGRLDDPKLLALVERHCRPLRDARVDTVVLGCTHYPFVRDSIQSALGADTRIVDTSAAVARRVATLARAVDATDATTPCSAPVEVETSGDPAVLGRIASAWLAFDTVVSALPSGV